MRTVNPRFTTEPQPFWGQPLWEVPPGDLRGRGYGYRTPGDDRSREMANPLLACSNALHG